jgi:hypothetical protein
MPASMIELEVLAGVPADDARAAIERLGALGPVILLVPEGATDRADRYVPAGVTNVTATPWAGARDRHAGGGLNRTAVARLQEIQAQHDVGWLIAVEATLATARACRGLRVVCIGPPGSDQEPTRPDHRAHSLLDAARFIETSEAFA